MYNVKIWMEQSLLTLATTNQKGELQVAYTDQRFAEAEKMLVEQQSPDGLAYFKQQALAAQQALSQVPPGPQRTQLAAKYVASLQNASSQLEVQKQTFRGQAPATKTTAALPTTAAEQTPPRPQIIVINQVTQVTQVIQVVQQIDQTQTQINTIINQVQNDSTNNSPSTSVQPTGIPSTPPTVAPTATPVPLPTATPIPTTSPIPQENGFGNNNGSNNGNNYGNNFGSNNGNFGGNH